MCVDVIKEISKFPLNSRVENVVEFLVNSRENYTRSFCSHLFTPTLDEYKRERERKKVNFETCLPRG
jgi:hypothetical protein